MPGSRTWRWARERGQMAYWLTIKGTDTVVGEVSAAQFADLKGLLEEEGVEDHDYYVDQAVLTFLQEQKADPALIALLRPHVPPEGGIEIVWTEDEQA